MKTSNSKKEEHRSEKSMKERKCKHGKRKNLLMEQEVRRETRVCELLGCLPWPERPLQIKGACCSVLEATKTFHVFFFWKKERYMRVAVEGA